MRRQVFASIVAGLSVQAPAQAQLDTIEPDGIRIFTPAYYTEFDPITALDLANRTPGFNIQESDGGRGLSGVRSNILIDGERPPPKGQSIRQMLDEMPFDVVLQLELIDAGSRLDIDMQGYPQVLNVITVPERSAYYEIVTQVARSGTGDVREQNQRSTDVDATGTFDWGDHTFTVSGSTQDLTNRSPADFVNIDPGNPEQRISSLSYFERDDENLELSGLLQIGALSSLSFNGRLRDESRGRAPIDLMIDGQPADTVDQSFQSDQDSQDLSAEFRREFASSGNLMVAFVDSVNNDQSESTLIDGSLVRSSVNSRESGETATRIRLTQSPTRALTIRTTATDAFNYIDGGYRLIENGIEQPIPGSVNRVEEDRRSLGSAVDWNFMSKWTFTGELGLESYEVRSPTLSTGTQTDPTGQLAVLFRPQARTTFTLKSVREVGQLSFGRFLASSNLSSGIVMAGASVLDPERSTTHSATYDRRFGDLGLLRVSLYQENVDNPVRQVALSDSTIVYRNTSAQKIDGVQGRIDYPFERFGRDDLVFSISGRIAESETIDPVTGESREVSGITSRYWQVELRRDPGNGRLAWGFAVAGWSEGDDFSVRSIRASEPSHEWQAQVQWEPIDNLKLTTRLEGPRHNSQQTLVFDTIRAPGLDPYFVVGTRSLRDYGATFSVEWRRHENFEITASLSSRPSERTEESLTPYGDMVGTVLATEQAQTPRATLRFRFYN